MGTMYVQSKSMTGHSAASGNITKKDRDGNIIQKPTRIISYNQFQKVLSLWKMFQTIVWIFYISCRDGLVHTWINWQLYSVFATLSYSVMKELNELSHKFHVSWGWGRGNGVMYQNSRKIYTEKLCMEPHLLGVGCRMWGHLKMSCEELNEMCRSAQKKVISSTPTP